jgi:dTMP kinase
MKPLLIAFEGIDGTGKSTQVERLAARLRAQGGAVTTTREPTYGPFGQQLRASARLGRLSPEVELDLLLQDRAMHVQDVIQPALRRGEVVLTDRYYLSTVAYQGVRGLNPATLRALNEAIAPAPALWLIFTLPISTAQARIRSAREGGLDLFEEASQLEACQAIFLSQAPTLAGAALIDASGAPDAVEAQVWRAVEVCLAATRPGVTRA